VLLRVVPVYHHHFQSDLVGGTQRVDDREFQSFTGARAVGSSMFGRR
jgi:hypothetical protein